MPGSGAVRLVVLNYNGGAFVLRCVEHLLALDWPAASLEVVVVDNASTDGSDAEIEQRFPDVRLIRSSENTGFPANNLALRDLTGIDFVGLVNNDAFVTRGYLRPLVAELESADDIGAVCPKILLAPRFRDLRITAEGWNAPGDGRVLGVRVSGIRVNGVDVEKATVYADGLWAPERGNAAEPLFRWTGVEALLRIPVADGSADPGVVASEVEIRLAAAAPSKASVDGGAGPQEVAVGPEPIWVTIPLHGDVYDVINNAGSELVAEGSGRDRGFLQRDVGQFDEPQDVFAWCGAGVLFRARHLSEVGLFDERFFMYYEDTDLAWRGRARGWRHRYVPSAVMRHMHAATSVEGSAMFNHFVERNRLLMLAKNAPAGFAARAAGRFLLSTASYARRDIVRPVRRGHRPQLGLVRARLRSYLAFLRLVPQIVQERRRTRPECTVHDEAILGWFTEP